MWMIRGEDTVRGRREQESPLAKGKGMDGKWDNGRDRTKSSSLLGPAALQEPSQPPGLGAFLEQFYFGPGDGPQRLRC